MKEQKNYSYEILDKTNDVVSTNECTGLIQIPPTSIDEAEAYSDIYVIPNQVNKLKRAKKK